MYHLYLLVPTYQILFNENNYNNNNKVYEKLCERVLNNNFYDDLQYFRNEIIVIQNDL